MHLSLATLNEKNSFADSGDSYSPPPVCQALSHRSCNKPEGWVLPPFHRQGDWHQERFQPLPRGSRPGSCHSWHLTSDCSQPESIPFTPWGWCSLTLGWRGLWAEAVTPFLILRSMCDARVHPHVCVSSRMTVSPPRSLRARPLYRRSSRRLRATTPGRRTAWA